MKKPIITLLVLTAWIFTLYAQNITISGKITDTSGESLPGVNVLLKGTQTGTITDLDGDYTIDVPGTSTILQFSFMGYEQQEIEVGDKTIINIILKESSIGIDEVVVTALGIKKEVKALGYSRQSVNTEEMMQAREPNVMNSLQGKVAGLQITDRGTGTTRINIRGSNSLMGNNEPLIVIDGIPVDNRRGEANMKIWEEQGEDEKVNIDYGNTAALINPDDIESIEVLKGGNAAALYGAQGANGAILITTKRGSSKDGRLGVEFSNNTQFTSVAEWPAYQNVYGGGHVLRTSGPGGNINYIPESGKYGRSWGGVMAGQTVLNKKNEETTYDPQPGNVKFMFQTGIIQTNSISFNKSDEKSSFRLTYTSLFGKSIMPNQEEQQRHSFLFRGTSKLSKSIEVDATGRYVKSNVDNRTIRNGSTRNPYQAFTHMTRSTKESDLKPWKDENGVHFENKGSVNPLWNLNENHNSDETQRFIGNFSLNIDLIKDLKYILRGQTDIIVRDGYDFVDKGAKGNEADSDGFYSRFNELTKNYHYEGLMMYNKEFNNFNIGATIGANAVNKNWKRETIFNDELSVQDLATITNSVTGLPINKFNISKSKSQSLFGSLSVGYSGYLFIDGSYRIDWASTLPVKSGGYNFISGNLSFIFTDAFKIANDYFPFGKIRISYAKTGNAPQPYNLINSYVSKGSYMNTILWGTDQVSRNPFLKPETTYSYEGGMDMRFLNNRLSIDGTLYYSYTLDQILRRKVSTSTGFEEAVVNSGRVNNKGIELLVNITPVQKANFRWDVNINWSKNISEVVEISKTDTTAIELINWANFVYVRFEQGQPYGVLRGTDFRRSVEGDIMVKDNGDVFHENEVFLGKVEPDWLGSIYNRFKIKNISFSFLVDFRKGGNMFSASTHKATVDANALRTLEGRENYMYSDLALGESDAERRGESVDGTLYTDHERDKGTRWEGYHPLVDPETGELVVDPVTGRYYNGEKNIAYHNPQEYWQKMDFVQSLNIFDCSYIKLREVTVGYSIPKKIVNKLPVYGLDISLVGRNLYTIYKNTPDGVDPEASSTAGNAQGIEFNSPLPMRTYGVNIKITF